MRCNCDKIRVIKRIFLSCKMAVKYNNTFDIHESKGTLKSIGSVKIDWYNSPDAENLRGRIKSIKGNTPTLHVTRLSSRRDW